MSTPRHKVTIIAPSTVATFIDQDRRLLARDFDAIVVPYPGLRNWRELRMTIAAADVVLIWFAGRHAAPAVSMARKLGKPIVTVVGGYEAAWLPEIGYGIRPGSWRYRLLRLVLRYSTRIIAVSSVTQDGIQAVDSSVESKLTKIYNAVDTAAFQFDQSKSRDGVLCVGRIDKSTMALKGWDWYWAIARAMPDVQFAAVGPADAFAMEHALAQTPPNLQWHGELSGDALVHAYQNASVYFQGSMHESFSLSLAESMACGCIPVTSRGGALPEVAGDTGYCVDYGATETAVRAIRQAMASETSKRDFARRRIVEMFSIERRQSELCSLVHELIA